MTKTRWARGIACLLVLSACGTTVLRSQVGPASAPTVEPTNVGRSQLTKDQQGKGLARNAPQLQGAARCATNSDPTHGYTATSIKWGTIIPLTGALRPLGEQTARVMRVAVQYLNSVPKIPFGFDWSCPTRPGVWGRTVELKVLSLNNNTQDEAAAAMRRLIDVEHVFLVRDCYLESNLMGPATQYQNQKKVPGIWCYFSEMPYPQMAPWNYAPGTDLLKVAAIHTGWLMNTLHRRRLAILSDPSLVNNQVRVVKQIYKYINGFDIPQDCIQYTKSQEAPGGMQTQIQAIRSCYQDKFPNTPEPDSVLALDALNGVFGAKSADNAGWGMRTSGVVWACATCWVQTLSDVCTEACEGMITDCQALPCIPWSNLPAAQTLEGIRRQYLPNEPKDVLTYGPIAITLGLGLWLGMTGPNLSQPGLIHTVSTLHNWDAGIGPILNTSTQDHFGGKAIWLLRFTADGFDDYTHGFKTLSEVGVPESLTKS
jgi:hypothetical protein